MLITIKQSSNMCQDTHHYKIKVHINLICSNFSPLMSVLTTYEHKEPVWKAKAESLIQVNENNTRAKNQNHLEWDETPRPHQLGKISVPKDKGNGSTQPRQAHMIPQEEAERAQHQSCDDRKLKLTAGSSRRGKGAQHHRQKSKRAQNSQAPPNHMH